MSHDALSVEIKSEHDGDAIVYRLRGSLDLSTSPSLRAALVEAANEGKHDIIVDLSHIEFLDSTGLGAIIGGHRRALENGGRVRLIVNEGPILRLFAITGLMAILSVYGSLDAALNDRDRLVASI